MLHALTRWFKAAPKPTAGWPQVAAWAEARDWVFRGVRESDGFVIEGRSGALPWRMEWGPSQRAYIDGFELRFRAELPVPGEMQVLLLSRPLMELMERTVFDQYVEGVQTRIDNQTPPEMRWLVMFPKLPGSEMPELRERYIALSSGKSWLAQWLQGPLSQSLAALNVNPATPMVLMIGRGRLMLRTALPDADVLPLQAWLRLFETAMREARRVANESSDSISPSTQPSMWQTSALPGDERQK